MIHQKDYQVLDENEKKEHCSKVFSDLGRAIANLRNHYKLTQSEAAAKLGITEKKMAAIERGTLYNNLDKVCKYVEILGGRIAIVPEEDERDPHCRFIEK